MNEAEIHARPAFPDDVLPDATASAQAEEMRHFLHPPRAIIWLAWLIRFSALVDLLSMFLPDRPLIIGCLGLWLPFEIAEGKTIRMFLVAILLFALAGALVRGKRTAWNLIIAGLAVAPLLHLGRTIIWPHFLINFILIAILFLHRDYFVANSDRRSVRSALILCPLLALFLLTFGTIRLHDLRDETSGDDDWLACAQTACELVLVHKTQTQIADTPITQSFFSVLRIGGTTIGLLGLFLTLRPVLLRRLERHESREKAQRLVDLHGQDPIDPYATLWDKRYFFHAENRVFIPYVLSGNLAVALADPIGLPAHRAEAIAQFSLFCRRQDWEPVFHQVSEELFPAYLAAGFSMFRIGEEARLRADDFQLRGNDFQNLRTARNRAGKLGIRFLWYFPDHRGRDENLENQLSAISQDWLRRKKTTEMSFDMGSFSVDEIHRHGAAVAIDAHGQALAFATWRPFAQGHGQALDLMRALPAGRNLMDFILVESIGYFGRQGIYDISLGTAPLANLSGSETELLAEEKVVQFLYENLNRIYGYKSLFEFKRKFRPRWKPRYVAYRRGAHLPLVGLALVRVHASEGLWKFLVG